MVVLENQALEVAKTTADSKSIEKNTGNTLLTWPIAVRERLLELFYD